MKLAHGPMKEEIQRCGSMGKEITMLGCVQAMFSDAHIMKFI